MYGIIGILCIVGFIYHMIQIKRGIRSEGLELLLVLIADIMFVAMVITAVSFLI